MSSDTAKENVSVVESSGTEWKNDKGNMDDPDIPNYREKNNTYHSGADYQEIPCDQIGISAAVGNGKLHGTRYFIIKSLNHENLQLSVKKGIWATQVMNEHILEEAFHNSKKVILIFSVNMSGFFQGYAQMTSSVGRRDHVWSQGSGGRNPWGRSFNVKWLRLHDLPFQKTLHLKNPWNQYKPVKISRDCQELHPDVGEALCELLDGKDVSDVNFKVDKFLRDDLSRPHIEPSVHSRDEHCNMPLMHMAPMMYPGLLYQHQIDASRFHADCHGADGMFLPEDLCIASGASKWKQSGYSQGSRSVTNIHEGPNLSSRFDVLGFSGESPHASTLTDEDILDMTYEEYLEAHSRGNKRVSGPSGSTQQSSISKENCEESQSGCSSKKRSCERKSE
ncbi:PREDICTED: uncharacterized protein LOC109168137 isoform X2 [Ipomoea nil]|uniref:uncharacterized protein LOC109168137 isoform X2 n=1 Tax=Ipomoea nil TaxID=35883 RepID=UPI0009019451|nr:PREDICTED: uncharacterized protein LOC109168137 isoform X2 [Ipomoea nil]